VIGASSFATSPAHSHARGQTTANEYARFASTHPGDSGRGQVLFCDLKRLACVRCHRVRGQGGDIGPDLSDIGGKFARAPLIESLLDPSRQIVEGYRTTTIATSNGQVLSGIVRDESPTGLVIVDALGERKRVPTAEIDDRKVDNTSLMPSDLALGLSLA